MARDFEDHCWKDIVDDEILEIYEPYRRDLKVGRNPAVLAIDLYNQAYKGGAGRAGPYRRDLRVGRNPAVLAIDLYNKAYQGGARPVREVNRLYSGSCGIHAWNALEPTRQLFAAARRAGIPVIYTTRHAETGEVQSTHRRKGREAEELYHIKAEVAPLPGDLVIYKEIG